MHRQEQSLPDTSNILVMNTKALNVGSGKLNQICIRKNKSDQNLIPKRRSHIQKSGRLRSLVCNLLRELCLTRRLWF